MDFVFVLVSQHRLSYNSHDKIQERTWLRLSLVMILISNVQKSASMKVNWMALF